MKKLMAQLTFAFTLIIISMVIGHTFAHADTIPYPENSYFSRFAVESDGVWFVSDDTLWYLDGRQYENSHIILQLDPDANALALTCLHGEAYAAKRQNGKMVVERINRSGEVELLFTLPYEREVRDIIAFNDALAVLWGYTDTDYDQGVPYGENIDYAFSLYSLSGTPIVTGIDRIANFAKQDEDTLLMEVPDDGAFSIVALNLNTGENVEIGHTEKGCPFAPSEDADIFYWLSFRGLGRINIKTGEEEILKPYEFTTFLQASIYVESDRVFIGIDQEHLYEYFDLNQIDSQSATVLTLVNVPSPQHNGCYGLLNKAIVQFKTIHPEVEVRFQEMKEEQLLTRLQAQEEGVDILYILAGAEKRYVDAGVLMDLSGHEAFERSLSDWIDIRKLVTYDQVLYGIPIAIFADSLSFNQDIFRQAGLTMPTKPYNWSGIFDLANIFQTSMNRNGQGDFILLHEVEMAVPIFIKQYTAMRDNPSVINFQTPEFGQMAEAYKGLVDRGLVADWSNYDLVDRALVACESVNAPNVWQAVPFEPLPMVGENDVIPVQADVMGVNARSKHAGLAAEFLALYASKEVQSTDWTLCLLKDIDSYPDADQLTGSTRQLIQNYQDYIEQSQPQLFNDDFHRFTKEVFSKYLEGTISTLDLQSQLQQRLSMILFE